MPNSYKELAVQSAKAAGAVLCGVDMMIDSLEEEATDTNYSIIEINFNPAIHIHCYPYIGKIERQMKNSGFIVWLVSIRAM